MTQARVLCNFEVPSHGVSKVYGRKEIVALKFVHYIEVSMGNCSIGIHYIAISCTYLATGIPMKRNLGKKYLSIAKFQGLVRKDY